MLDRARHARRFPRRRASPPPEPAPVTTIAWRVAYIGDTLVRHPLREAAFGRRAGPVAADAHPHDAAGALAFVDEAIVSGGSTCS